MEMTPERKSPQDADSLSGLEKLRTQRSAFPHSHRTLLTQGVGQTGRTNPSHEHSGHLQAAPLRGASQMNLGPLATEATAQGTVSIDEAETRMVVSSATQDLIAQGQIARPPEAAILINRLLASSADQGTHCRTQLGRPHDPRADQG